MLLCAAGDIHGAIDRMYEDVLKFEAAIGECFDWVLHVGDLRRLAGSNSHRQKRRERTTVPATSLRGSPTAAPRRAGQFSSRATTRISCGSTHSTLRRCCPASSIYAMGGRWSSASRATPCESAESEAAMAPLTSSVHRSIFRAMRSAITHMRKSTRYARIPLCTSFLSTTHPQAFGSITTGVAGTG